MKISGNNFFFDYLYQEIKLIFLLKKQEKIKKSKPIFPNKDKIKKIKKKSSLVDTLICHETLKTSFPAHFWAFCTKNPITIILSNNFLQLPAFILL